MSREKSFGAAIFPYFFYFLHYTQKIVVLQIFVHKRKQLYVHPIFFYIFKCFKNTFSIIGASAPMGRNNASHTWS